MEEAMAIQKSLQVHLKNIKTTKITKLKAFKTHPNQHQPQEDSSKLPSMRHHFHRLHLLVVAQLYLQIK